MSSTCPRPPTFSPGSAIFSLGKQGRDSLHCMSQDAGTMRHGCVTETRSDSDLRRRTLAPMVSGSGVYVSGLRHSAENNSAEDGYSSSDATVTALSSNRSRLRMVPSGTMNMQRRRQEDPGSVVDSHPTIKAINPHSNERASLNSERLGVSKQLAQSARGSSDQAVNAPTSKRYSLEHRDPPPFRSGPGASDSLYQPEQSSETTKQSLEPTIYIPRSFSFDDVMDYPLSTDPLSYTPTGVDLANLVTETTVNRTAVGTATYSGVRKARGIPRIDMEGDAGYDTWLESGSGPRFSKRRLSEGSSSIAKSSQRPRMQRNIPSDVSYRSRFSFRDTSGSEGASSPADWDGPVFPSGSTNSRGPAGSVDSSIRGVPIPDSEWPTSPFSEDERLITATRFVSLRQPQKPSPGTSGTILPALLLGLRLLAVVPATVGSVTLLWEVFRTGTRDTQQLADHLAALPWAVLTGVFCFELTSGLTQRWLVHYALAPTLLRMVSLQSLCWPCTYFTLRYVGAVNMLLAWIVVCTTTACSRSIQIWVTSNVPDPIHRTLLPPRGSRAIFSSAITAFIGSSRRQKGTREPEKLDQEVQLKERFWDWEEIGQLVWFPVAILYALTTWFLLLTRIALA